MRLSRLVRIVGVFCLVGLLNSCRVASPATAAATTAQPGPAAPTTPAIERVSGNPFAGGVVFYPTYTNADQARRRLLRDSPAEAALIAKIADTPQARWLGEWSGPIATVADNYVKVAHKRGKIALLVAYNVPNRDCGQYSGGGAKGGPQYREWIQQLAKGITNHRRAIVVLEPDALGHLKECLSAEHQAERLALLREAVDALQAQPGVSVYLDAGHSRWVAAEEMAIRLRAAGVAHARGFALNTSNYIGDDELRTYGDRLVELLGPGTHYIIDSSRNGNGPASADQWCNPEGRALGRRPELGLAGESLDAFAWLKNPGESDGTCEGGPEAGQWFHERALEMARNAKW